MTTENPANATQVAESKEVTSSVETPTADQVKATQDPAVVEEKPSEAKPPEKVVPEKYELKADEAKFLSQADIARIEKTAKEKGMSNDEAQNLMNHENALIKSFSDAQHDDYVSKVDAWKQQVSVHPEFGGDKFAESAEASKRAIEKFGTPELKAIMDSTGFGNHPEVFAAFARIGKAMADDTLVLGGSKSNKPTSTQVLYPTMK